MENIRELAVDMLSEIMEEGSYCHLVIRSVLQKYNYRDSRDKAFLKRLVEGTVERCIQIDYMLDQFSKVPTVKMKPFIRNLLRSSVYQLLFMDSVPDRAVCNEAVKLAGKRGFRQLSGFVNGVLRNIARNKEQICFPEEEKDLVKALSVKFSMPAWLVEKLLKEQGEEKTRRMLEAFLQTKPVTIRLKEDLSASEKERLISAIEKTGCKMSAHPYLPYAYCIEGAEGLLALPGFEEGLFQVQDVSSMLVCECAGIREGDRILDLCAAPGGKSIHAAQKLKGTGLVVSRDISEEKTALIRENQQRMKIQNMEVSEGDARIFCEEDKEVYDVVLADLPCSGLGIMGKKPDIRYHAKKEGLESLKALQREILKNAVSYVKPGGILLYSTCTINQGENEENAVWLSRQFPFGLESLSPYLPEVLKEEGKDGMLQLIPGVHETDGFFIARLKKQENKQT